MASERDAAKDATTDPEESVPELEAKIAEGKAKAAALKRSHGLQEHLHIIVIFGLYLIGSLIVVAIAVWLYHFIVPSYWRFLTPEQIESLQEILFSGFIGGVIASQAKKFQNEALPKNHAFPLFISFISGKLIPCCTKVQ